MAFNTVRPRKKEKLNEAMAIHKSTLQSLTGSVQGQNRETPVFITGMGLQCGKKPGNQLIVVIGDTNVS